MISGNCFALLCEYPSPARELLVKAHGQRPPSELCAAALSFSFVIHRRPHDMGNYRNSYLLRSRYVRSLYSVVAVELIGSEHAPGSLREPMPTSIWPAHGLVKLGTTFGLIAAAVSLDAVFLLWV